MKKIIILLLGLILLAASSCGRDVDAEEAQKTKTSSKNNSQFGVAIYGQSKY